MINVSDQFLKNTRHNIYSKFISFEDENLQIDLNAWIDPYINV